GGSAARARTAGGGIALAVLGNDFNTDGVRRHPVATACNGSNSRRQSLDVERPVISSPDVGTLACRRAVAEPAIRLSGIERFGAAHIRITPIADANRRRHPRERKRHDTPEGNVALAGATADVDERGHEVS